MDDFIYGADTKEAVLAIFFDLTELLSKRCFNLTLSRLVLTIVGKEQNKFLSTLFYIPFL